MEELVKWLNERTKEYDAGNPTVSDYEWDKAYFKLQNMEAELDKVLPDSPTHRIKYETVNELKKVKHNHFMGSAAKTKDWDEFINYFGEKDVTGMLKLDGLTLSLRYEGGHLKSAETRGDGEIGEDVLHNAIVIPSIPKIIDYGDELIIDGEIIITADDFEEFKNEYKNQRNLASGSIRLLDPNECKRRNLTFVAWNVVKGLNKKTLIEKFNIIDKLGFTVVPWTSSFDWDAKDFLIEQAQKFGYPIDGLIGRFNDIEYGESLGATGHHSKAIYAFKFYDEEYETELINIEWSMGRTGQLTPVAIYKDIDIDGSTCNRASLHNVSVLEETLGMPFRGQKIKVYKANEIIPQISWAEKWTIDKPFLMHPVACPICGGQVTYKKNEDVETVWCENAGCEGQLLNKIDHFVGKKGLDVKGLSKATIGKLIELGWLNRRADIFELSNHKKEWQNLSGFGVKSVENILGAIETAKNTNFEAYLSSLGIPLIGRTVSKELAKRFGSYDEFRKAIREGFDFSSLDGFGYEMSRAIKNFDYAEADEIAGMLHFEAPQVDAPAVQTVSGLTFVITGKLSRKRDDIKADIEKAGGKVTGSVSAKTNYLVCNDKTSTTGKSADAAKHGTPIITEEELFDILKN